MEKEKRAHVTVLRKPKKDSSLWAEVYGYERDPPVCNCESDNPCCENSWGRIKAQFR